LLPSASELNLIRDLVGDGSILSSIIQPESDWLPTCRSCLLTQSESGGEVEGSVGIQLLSVNTCA